MVEEVEKKDVGEIGEVLREVMKKVEEVRGDELKSEKRKLFWRLLGRVCDCVEEML